MTKMEALELYLKLCGIKNQIKKIMAQQESVAQQQENK